MQGELWVGLVVVGIVSSTGTRLKKVHRAYKMLLVALWLDTIALVYGAFVETSGNIAAFVPLALPLVFSLPMSGDDIPL